MSEHDEPSALAHFLDRVTEPSAGDDKTPRPIDPRKLLDATDPKFKLDVEALEPFVEEYAFHWLSPSTLRSLLLTVWWQGKED